MAEILLLGLDEHEVALAARRPALALDIDGVTVEVVEQAEGGSGPIRIVVDGREWTGWRIVRGPDVFLRLAGRNFHVRRKDPLFSGAGANAGADDITAPMPGVVVSVSCAAGDSVKRGQPLITIESMKLQTVIAAHRDGIVAAVVVEAEASFAKDSILISLYPEDAARAGMVD